MSFTENPRSVLCSAGVCCGTCGVEAELEAYAPLVRSVAWRYAGRGAEFALVNKNWTLDFSNPVQ